ncbi:unnamed protein product [Paramecium pentaurelia]|uniref:Ubiquitin-like domain-containing protein n=1 Tax=Paramecium pentaurelia TaxID=43138 RepID=A0A8S1X4R0_9CILI|nr:unnamed protein product [Paramecium pentaurelia]
MGKYKSRSRSRSHKKKKHKNEKQKTKDIENESKDWRNDKIYVGQKSVQAGLDVLEIIKKERKEDEEKLEQWKKKVGYTGLKVKAPLNIYEEIMKKNIVTPVKPVNPSLLNNPQAPRMIEILVNDRLGKKERIKCCPQDKIGDLKKLIAVKIGVRPEKIRLQKQHSVFKDHITLEDYEIKHEMCLEMYYN